jgi:hypothetical protein
VVDCQEFFDTLVLYLVFATLLLKNNTKGKCNKKVTKKKKMKKIEVLVSFVL